MKKSNTICFVAGRSGGHIKPALTLAQHYCIQYPDARIIFFSTNTPLDHQIINESAIVTHHISLTLSNIPRSLMTYPWYCIQFFWCILKSIGYLHTYKPKKILSIGGYISLPVCFAAKLLFIPIELFEVNAVPGKASTVLASFSTKINVCFKSAKSYFPAKKVHTIAYPIHYDQPINLPEQARATLQLIPNKKTILILGGSQGSLFINTLTKSFIEQNAKNNALQIIHQTGKQDTFNWNDFYTAKNIPSRVFSYSTSMELFYQAADLIICRAGAGTLFEAVYFKKPCMVIPLQTKTTSHQLYNAQALAQEYPELITVFYQHEFKHNEKIFFATITKHLI